MPGAYGQARNDPSANGSDANQQARQAWNEVAATGLTLLEKLGQAMDASNQSDGGNGSSNPLDKPVQRNETTGGSELRIPLPDHATLDRFADLLRALARP